MRAHLSRNVERRTSCSNIAATPRAPQSPLVCKRVGRGCRLREERVYHSLLDRTSTHHDDEDELRLKGGGHTSTASPHLVNEAELRLKGGGCNGTASPRSQEGAIPGGREELPRLEERDGLMERSPARRRERPEDCSATDPAGSAPRSLVRFGCHNMAGRGRPGEAELDATL
jgi:hypothetical protein